MNKVIKLNQKNVSFKGQLRPIYEVWLLIN